MIWGYSWDTSIFKKLLPRCCDWTVTQSCYNMMNNFSTSTNLEMRTAFCQKTQWSKNTRFCLKQENPPQKNAKEPYRAIFTVDLMRNPGDFDGSCGILRFHILQHPYISQVATFHTFASCEGKKERCLGDVTPWAEIQWIGLKICRNAHILGKDTGVEKWVQSYGSVKTTAAGLFRLSLLFWFGLGNKEADWPCCPCSHQNCSQQRMAMAKYKYNSE